MTGDQTHKPERPSTRHQRAAQPSPATLRRRLTAIARDRLLQLPEGSKLHELWRGLETGWVDCGWATLFRNASTGTVVGLPDHCDKIGCPYCELRRCSRVRDRYRARATAALEEHRLYLVTLTVPNVPLGELATAIAELRKAIAKLRRRSWWTDEVAGGLWRLEVTWNPRARTWHPHANLLFETRSPIRMATWQPLIQDEWRRVSPRYVDGRWQGRDSCAINGQWIWLLPGWDGALVEAVKRQVVAARDGAEIAERDTTSSVNYTVKPQLAPEWVDPSDPAMVIEYVETFARSRTVSSFGSWRGIPEPDPEPSELLIEAPYAPGDDFFAKRFLPVLDPLTSTTADWKWWGRGPRHSLRPLQPPGDKRREWLVWHESDGTVPPDVADDTAIDYQAGIPFGPPARD